MTQKIAEEKAEALILFYKNTVDQMKRLRLKKNEEWEIIIEDSYKKLKQSKQVVFEMVETFFKNVEERLINQYLIPSRESAMQRIELPISVFFN